MLYIYHELGSLNEMKPHIIFRNVFLSVTDEANKLFIYIFLRKISKLFKDY